jgi:ankyrin repeat protein
MKCVNTKSVKSLTEIDRTLNIFEKIHKIRKLNGNYVRDDENDFSDNFEEMTRQLKLFEYVASGHDDDIDKIAEIVRDDKMRNMYDVHQKEHYFINKRNYDGFTALYVACLNGHIKVVDVLLKNHADHLMKCGVKIFYIKFFKLIGFSRGRIST